MTKARERAPASFSAPGIAVTVMNAPDDDLEHEDRNFVAEITVGPHGG
ncbi:MULTISPECIES: hypothetical protein [Curtobacterium]|jgi:hypothetical protein|nr:MULTISPECIES: hypothetical protein [Curtobacterium]MBT1619960.1 hypothetical protein [Curtobacterium flaccumfaciens pv. poinsettiae]UXZ58033.1 hypothetical protein MXD64_01230 [Curtobacterium sp. Arg-1]